MKRKILTGLISGALTALPTAIIGAGAAALIIMAKKAAEDNKNAPKSSKA